MVGESNSNIFLKSVNMTQLTQENFLLDLINCSDTFLQATVGRQTDLEVVLQCLRGENASVNVSQEAADIMVT